MNFRLNLWRCSQAERSGRAAVRWLFLAGALALASPSWAIGITYYLRSDGHDGASGGANTTDVNTGAKQHLSAVNSIVFPGDKVIVISLAVSDTTLLNAIAPARDGNPSGYI